MKAKIPVNSLVMTVLKSFVQDLDWLRCKILKTGFFHVDPHPGNLAVDVDESLTYYDFGMMGEVQSFTREKLLQLFYAVYEKDVRKEFVKQLEAGDIKLRVRVLAVIKTISSVSSDDVYIVSAILTV
ncbi:hypothetical protein Dsin_031842 [Dipteronia sinensis]|uniref:ABC1 atypical kinase-like domain-containing protein n=1 Tax=Dipteronia sinensis TaxID=43782 RepID=A0AAD9ZM45_9ROSI|nr:hypothetical protein Dsin_031842 [Dipteronia sinensis]